MARRAPRQTGNNAKDLKKARSMAPRLARQQRAPRPEEAQRRKEALTEAGGFLLRLVMPLAVLLLVTGVLMAGYVLASSNSLFAVRRADVLGTVHLSRMEVLAAAGIGMHSNLLAMRPREIKQRVLELPWVRGAEVERHLPGTVTIRVSEHRPRALALAGGRLYYLDGDLRPFAEVEGSPVGDMVVITGLEKADLLEPDSEVAELLAAAAGLLADPELGHGRLGALSEMHLDRTWGVSLVWNQLPAVVRLGFGDYDARMQRLTQVLDDLAKRGESPRATLIDLDAERRVVVRLQRDEA